MAGQAKPVKPVPDGYHTLTPYLSVKGAAEAIEFYRRALGAELLYKLDMPDGRIGHAELRLGTSRVMLADEFPELPDPLCLSPGTVKGTTCSFMVYLEDCDAAVERAVEAGARLLRPVKDEFYGDRSGTVADPFGHVWTLATHVEDVSPEEMARRAGAAPPG